MRITLPNYEHYHNDKDLVKGSATKVGEIQIVPTADLRHVRELIKKLLDQDQDANFPRIGDDWVFVDCEYFWLFSLTFFFIKYFKII